MRSHSDGTIIAKTSGFAAPAFGLIHCDMLQISKLSASGGEGGMMGTGVLLGTSVLAHGWSIGCRKAEILAINDDGEQLMLTWGCCGHRLSTRLLTPCLCFRAYASATGCLLCQVIILRVQALVWVTVCSALKYFRSRLAGMGSRLFMSSRGASQTCLTCSSGVVWARGWTRTLRRCCSSGRQFCERVCGQSKLKDT